MLAHLCSVRGSRAWAVHCAMSDPVAAANQKVAEARQAFARDGFFVMRGVLDQDTISSLRRDAAVRAAGQDLEKDSTVWVHSTRELPLYAPARLDAAAYLELRAQGGASACPLIAQALLHTLPSLAAEVTGWEQGGVEQGGVEQGGWRLFNEHYVIKPGASDHGKPAGGGQHFLWHRDADRHLRCAERVAIGAGSRASTKASRLRTVQPRAALEEPPGEEQQAEEEEEGEEEEAEEEEPVEGRFYAGPPPSAAVAYVNTWSPLDDCDASNGTLCLLPASTPAHRDSASPAARPCSLEACEARHAVPMCLRPGDVCVFSSYVFHTSRPNRSPSPRWHVRM